MDDNKQFLESLAKLDGVFEGIDIPSRNQSDPHDDSRQSNPETRDHGIERKNSLDFNRNFLTGVFSRETDVASDRPTQFSIPGYGQSRDTLISYSLGAQHSVSEASKASRAISYLLPEAPSGGGFSRTAGNESNRCEPLSSSNYYNMNNWWPAQQMEPKNASSGTETSSGSKKEKNLSNFSRELFPERKPNHLVSISSPQMPKERDESRSLAQTTENYRTLSSTSSIFSPIEDASNIDMNTERVSIGPVADAETISVAGPQGIQTLSRRSGKVKAFECEVCGNKFGLKSSLYSHRKIHKGDKSFVCKTCGQTFTYKDSLRQHLLIHTDEKPYACLLCDRKFRQQSQLTYHIRTHTEERPFACDLCKNKFSVKCNLRRHIRWHTGGEIHQCKICCMDFASRTNCIEHQKTEHAA